MEFIILKKKRVNIRLFLLALSVIFWQVVSEAIVQWAECIIDKDKTFKIIKKYIISSNIMIRIHFDFHCLDTIKLNNKWVLYFYSIEVVNILIILNYKQNRNRTNTDSDEYNNISVSSSRFEC